MKGNSGKIKLSIKNHVKNKRKYVKEFKKCKVLYKK